jgi:hypothetical protein
MDMDYSQPGPEGNTVAPEPAVAPTPVVPVVKPTQYSGSFTYSNIYYYRYNPKGLGKLPVFDMYPLMLPLDIRGPLMLGINLHWIPVPLRFQFIQVVLAMQEKSINKNAFRLFYNTVKSQPALSFALMAVRKYYIGRCAGVQLIPNEDWNNLPMVWETRYRARFMKQITPIHENVPRGPITPTTPTKPTFH